MWGSRTAAARLLGSLKGNVIAQLTDLDDCEETVGMSGSMNPKTELISDVHAVVVWRPGWTQCGRWR